MPSTQLKSKDKEPKQPKKLTRATVETSSAEASFRALEPVLAEIEIEDARPITVDVQESAMVAIAADQVLRRPEHAAVIEVLAKMGIIRLGLVDRLGDVARATFYARHRLLMASSSHSEATLPNAILEPAMACRMRMRRTLEYNLEGEVEAAGRLAQLRVGNGYLDLANDLLGYADLYAEHADAIEEDKKNFRKEDEALARKLAEQMISLLGVSATSEQAKWRAHQGAAWFLLQRHYDEAARLGRFLYHGDGAAELFPSLITAARNQPSREKPREDGAKGEAKPEPAPDGAGPA